MQVIVRWQRIALSCGGALAVLTLAGAELGARALLLALPGTAALMSALIGGLLWTWAALLRFDPPGEDENPNEGPGGPKVPGGPSTPLPSDWDRFDAERRNWARDREPTSA